MNQKRDNLEIRGFFLSFDDEQWNDINEFLKELGYDGGSEGLKEFILDAVYNGSDVEENSSERVIRKTKRYLEDHPDTVDNVLKIVSNLTKMAMKKART